jgi:hypothetical protein
MEKNSGSFALQAGPHEKAGEEKEKRHQKDVLPGTKQVKPDEARVVDHRKGAPEVRGLVEREWRRRQKFR